MGRLFCLDKHGPQVAMSMSAYRHHLSCLINIYLYLALTTMSLSKSKSGGLVSEP